MRPSLNEERAIQQSEQISSLINLAVRDFDYAQSAADRFVSICDRKPSLLLCDRLYFTNRIYDIEQGDIKRKQGDLIDLLKTVDDMVFKYWTSVVFEIVRVSNGLSDEYTPLREWAISKSDGIRSERDFPKFSKVELLKEQAKYFLDRFLESDRTDPFHIKSWKDQHAHVSIMLDTADLALPEIEESIVKIIALKSDRNNKLIKRTTGAAKWLGNAGISLLKKSASGGL
ncbi:MAG: hypothetical protein N4A70_09480 [Pelagimonas sp.]|jgi:hypothetical protein|nr:hypothetical protein [Pelagimonas sp.]